MQRNLTATVAVLALTTHYATAQVVPHVVVLGDSIAYGLSASIICAPRIPALATTCPSTAKNWAYRVALQYNGYYQNLGISGADARTVLTYEVQNIDPQATLVILNVGSNDTESGDGIKDYGAAFQQLFTSNYNLIISDIQAAAPTAQIVLITPKNTSYTTAYSQPGYVLDARSKIERNVINGYSSRFTIVDEACDPNRYNPLDLTYRLLHPNNTGEVAYTVAVENALTTPAAPATSCPPWF